MVFEKLLCFRGAAKDPLLSTVACGACLMGNLSIVLAAQGENMF
jgi:hypothetical protein